MWRKFRKTNSGPYPRPKTSNFPARFWPEKLSSIGFPPKPAVIVVRQFERTSNPLNRGWWDPKRTYRSGDSKWQSDCCCGRLRRRGVLFGRIMALNWRQRIFSWITAARDYYGRKSSKHSPQMERRELPAGEAPREMTTWAILINLIWSWEKKKLHKFKVSGNIFCPIKQGSSNESSLFITLRMIL